MTSTPPPDNAGTAPDPPATTIPSPEPDRPASDAPDPGRANRSILFTAAVAAVAVATLLLIAMVFSDDTGDAADPADAAGILALAFLTDDGGTGTLGDYEGQPMVVNFFASWCPPCRAELPDFEAVHQELGDEVVFLGVNQDFTEETWRAFVAETPVTYETVFQPDSEIWSALGTGAMPTTAFLSPDGEVVGVWAGVLTDDKLTELIDQHLLEAP